MARYCSDILVQRWNIAPTLNENRLLGKIEHRIQQILREREKEKSVMLPEQKLFLNFKIALNSFLFWDYVALPVCLLICHASTPPSWKILSERNLYIIKDSSQSPLLEKEGNIVKLLNRFLIDLHRPEFYSRKAVLVFF